MFPVGQKRAHRRDEGEGLIEQEVVMCLGNFDDRRIALQRSIANLEGVFEASAADFAAIMERDA